METFGQIFQENGFAVQLALTICATAIVSVLAVNTRVFYHVILERMRGDIFRPLYGKYHLYRQSSSGFSAEEILIKKRLLRPSLAIWNGHREFVSRARGPVRIRGNLFHLLFEKSVDKQTAHSMFFVCSFTLQSRLSDHGVSTGIIAGQSKQNLPYASVAVLSKQPLDEAAAAKYLEEFQMVHLTDAVIADGRSLLLSLPA